MTRFSTTSVHTSRNNGVALKAALTGGRRLDLFAGGRLVLVAIGKASWRMAKAAADSLGGRLDGGVVVALQGRGRNAEAALAENDSYHALDACGSLVRTGPTGTNVNDVVILLCGGGS